MEADECRSRAIIAIGVKTAVILRLRIPTAGLRGAAIRYPFLGSAGAEAIQTIL